MVDKARKMIDSNPDLKRVFTYLYKFLPIIVGVTYVIMLLTLWKNQDYRIAKTIEVPIFVFVGVTILRKVINFKRPYEEGGIDPMIPKDKSGESFPSRHVASATIIAMAAMGTSIATGVMLLIISVIIGVMRVISGVHYKKDVIAGFVISFVIGFVVFVV